MILAGLGTGIAPMRAIVQYRMYQKQQQKIHADGNDCNGDNQFGPMILFYGCRLL
jgi:sulfite reductase alpha subunit-like flavoprotein